MIVACVSSYAEGSLIDSCLDSADMLEHTFRAEGAVGEGERWKDDAAKRTHLLQLAKHAYPKSQRKGERLWVLWLDGDELLLWGEYLKDMTARAEAETGAAGFPLRLVELDGSVAMCQGKIVDADVIRKYLHSSYQVELHTGMVVALPNVKICSAGGMPVRPADGWPEGDELEAYLARHRPPLHGEPHLLHRSVLRDPGRNVRRLSDVESDWFQESIRAAGLGEVD